MENSKEIIKSDGDEEGVDNKLFNPFTAHLGDCNESSLDFKGPDAVWQLKVLVTELVKLNFDHSFCYLLLKCELDSLSTTKHIVYARILINLGIWN